MSTRFWARVGATGLLGVIAPLSCVVPHSAFAQEQVIEQAPEQGVEQAPEQDIEQGVEQAPEQDIEQGVEQDIEQAPEQGIDPAPNQGIACAIPEPIEAPAVPPAREDIHQLATGAGTTVAVIDTGIAKHPQLPHLEAGADFLTPAFPNPFHDCDGHGTVVAGIIAGADHGVAPDARIVSIRQTSGYFSFNPADPGRPGSLASLADAIHDAINHHADVINISVVSCVPASARVDDQILRDALTRAEESGAVVVAAAGNESDTCPAGSFVYPAHLPTVVAVGARDGEYSIADYSLDVPDDQVALSAAGIPHAALSPSGEGYASGIYPREQSGLEPFAGTSFAAPVVSGTVALLRQRFPQDSPAELRQRLYRTAEPAGGYLDPYQALSSAGPAQATAHTEHQVRLQVADQADSFALRRATWLLLSISGLVALLVLVIGVCRFYFTPTSEAIAEKTSS